MNYFTRFACLPLTRKEIFLNMISLSLLALH
jgi:hypothetical protein